MKTEGVCLLEGTAHIEASSSSLFKGVQARQKGDEDTLKYQVDKLVGLISSRDFASIRI